MGREAARERTSPHISLDSFRRKLPIFYCLPASSERIMAYDGQTLFVVDDDPKARKSVAALAASMDIGCEAFASAEEFLVQYEPTRAGCVLIDIRLKGMDGPELQRRLASIGSLLPVILISAYADVPTAVRAMQDGALAVIEKPYEGGELVETIQAAMELDRRRRAESARRAETQRRLDELDPRERQVLDLMIAGTPSKVIARRLEISQRTVDRLRAAIFSTMGVESAVEVAAMVGELRAAPRPSTGFRHNRPSE